MQPKQRRFVVPAVFAVVALVLGWAAVQEGSGTPTATAAGAEPPARAVTPVLSARRLAPYLVAPIADAALRAQLDEVVAASPEATCLTVSVGGRLIYEHNPDMALVPASTEKLVTAVAALSVLGRDTTLHHHGRRRGRAVRRRGRRRPLPRRRRRSAPRDRPVRGALPQPAADPHLARGAGRPGRRRRGAPGERTAARRREPLRLRPLPGHLARAVRGAEPGRPAVRARRSTTASPPGPTSRPARAPSRARRRRTRPRYAAAAARGRCSRPAG